MTMTKTNTLFTKSFFKTLLWKQNKYHRHGVFLHTMRVVYYALINGDLKMLLNIIIPGNGSKRKYIPINLR